MALNAKLRTRNISQSWIEASNDLGIRLVGVMLTDTSKINAVRAAGSWAGVRWSVI